MPHTNFQQIDEAHDKLLVQLDERRDQKGMPAEEALRDLEKEIRIFIANVSDAGRDLYLDQERSAAQSLLNYWTNALTRASIEHLPSSLLPFTEEPHGEPVEVDFPFDLKGRNQRMKWDHYSAGRRLRSEAKKVWGAKHFVAIVGASGSGRRTATEEVIVPAVREWMREENGVEPQVITVPAREGAVESLFETIRTNEASRGVVAEADHPLQRLARTQMPPTRMLLVIHELRTLLQQLDQDEDKWESWLQALLQWVQEGHALVVVVNYSHLRSLAGYPDFLTLVTEQEVNTDYDSSELREFIEMPARAAQVYFEEGLVERIVRNSQGQLGVLALLNFSLERLWEVFKKRGGHKLIKQTDYESVGSGRGAVDRAANEALKGFPENDVKAVFLCLVTPTLEGWETHAVPLANLQRESPAHGEAIAMAFHAAKILKFRSNAAGEPLVLVRHHTLAGCWSKLQCWIESVRDEMLPHLLLPRVARRWSRAKQSDDLLWRGELLEAVEPHASEKSALEQRFITAAVRARFRRKLAKAVPIAALVAIVSMIIVGLTLRERALSGFNTKLDAKNAELNEAQARLMTERAERLLATQDPAGALLWFDRGEASSERGDWRARRASIAARSLPELFRLATLKGKTSDGAAADSATAFKATGVWMEYAPEGSHGLIAARNLGEQPGGLLLWDFKDNEPRVVARGRSYERVKFFAPEALGEMLVATISAEKAGDESGRLELWKWAELRDAKAPAKPLAVAELRAFPLDLAIEARVTDDGARQADGNLLAIGTGEGKDANASRVLLFEVKKNDASGAEIVPRTDLDPAFKTRGKRPTVNAVQFSRNGLWLLSGAGDVDGERGEALLFSREADGRKFRGEPRRLKHDAPVANVDFCVDNTRFVTATGAQQRGPGEARLWTIPKENPVFGELVSIPLPHRARVVEAWFSPDGRRLVTASQDGAARIWDAENGMFNSILEHDGWLFAARWSPDGRQILTGSRDGFARLWDATTGLLAWPKLAHTGSVSLARFAPDGQSVFTGTGREFRIWRWHAGQAQPIPTLPQGTVADAAFSPDGRWLATGVKRTDRTELGEVVLADATTGNERTRFSVGGPVNKVIFSADGRWLAAAGGRRGGEGGIIRIWDVADPEKLHAPIVTAEPAVWIGFAEKADRLVALLHNAAKKWSQIVVLHPSDGQFHCPPFDPKSGEPKDEAADETVNALAISPDGTFVAVGGGNLTQKKRFLTVFDLTSANEQTPPVTICIKPETHRHLEAITALAFQPKGRQLISGSVDNWVRIFDFTKLCANQEDASVGGREQNADISSVGFSADGSRAFSCAYDGQVLVMNAAEADPKPHAFDHPGAVRSACFNRAGTLLATGGDDRNVRLWNIKSGDLVGIFSLPWPLAAVHLSPQAGSAEASGGDEHLLTTSFYYTQHLTTRGVQRIGPPDTASFSLSARTPMRADTSVVNKRRVDARRWNISAAPMDSLARVELLAARKVTGERMFSKTVNDLETLRAELSPPPDPHGWHARAANLCEEQELWTAARWHFQRANPTPASYWQNLRLLFGAVTWPKVLAACAAASSEFTERPEFLRLQAEAQMAASGDKAALEASRKTLEKWEGIDRLDIIPPLRIAEVLFFLGDYTGADKKLQELTKREQPKAFLPAQGAPESGTLPSLWQRRAEHRLLITDPGTDAETQKWAGPYCEAAYALLENFGNSPDNGGVVAWPFALAPRHWWIGHEKLAPEKTEEWERIVGMADLAVEIDPTNFYRLNTLGGLLVRSGRFAEAIPWLEEARRISSQRNPSTGGGQSSPAQENRSPRKTEETASPAMEQQQTRITETGRPLDWCFLALAHAGLAGKTAPQSPEHQYHQERAEHFAKLACNRKLWKSPGAGNVWRDELTRRELEFLRKEVVKILPEES